MTQDKKNIHFLCFHYFERSEIHENPLQLVHFLFYVLYFLAPNFSLLFLCKQISFFAHMTSNELNLKNIVFKVLLFSHCKNYEPNVSCFTSPWNDYLKSQIFHSPLSRKSLSPFFAAYFSSLLCFIFIYAMLLSIFKIRSHILQNRIAHHWSLPGCFTNFM